MSQVMTERLLAAGVPAEVINMRTALAECGLSLYTAETGRELVERVRQRGVSSITLRLSTADSDAAYLATAALAKAWVVDQGGAVFRRMQDVLRAYERYQTQDRGDYSAEERALLFPEGTAVLFVPDLLEWAGWAECTRVQIEDALGMLHRYVARGAAICYPVAPGVTVPKTLGDSQVYGAMSRRTHNVLVQTKGKK